MGAYLNLLKGYLFEQSWLIEKEWLIDPGRLLEKLIYSVVYSNLFLDVVYSMVISFYDDNYVLLGVLHRQKGILNL